MTIDLTGRVEEQLRDLALRQGRDISVLVEEALQEYLAAAAITDLDPAAVAESQVAMLGEFRGVPEWKGGGE